MAKKKKKKLVPRKKFNTKVVSQFPSEIMLELGYDWRPEADTDEEEDEFSLLPNFRRRQEDLRLAGEENYVGKYLLVSVEKVTASMVLNTENTLFKAPVERRKSEKGTDVRIQRGTR